MYLLAKSGGLYMSIYRCQNNQRLKRNMAYLHRYEINLGFPKICTYPIKYHDVDKCGAMQK